MMRLALYQPDIPQNTGAILRLTACLGVPLDVILPTGFEFSDHRLKRAGMDYADLAHLTRHQDFARFLASIGKGERATAGAGKAMAASPAAYRLILLTTRANQSLFDFQFQPDDVLLLGRESAGVPPEVHQLADARLKLPILAGRRSLNIAVAGAMALAEALRQTAQLPGQQSA